MTNFELGVRVPLIVRAPWATAVRGKFSDELAELVDLYPTLAELAGLPPAGATLGERLGGTSLAPIFSAPTECDLAVREINILSYFRPNPNANPNPNSNPNPNPNPNPNLNPTPNPNPPPLP